MIIASSFSLINGGRAGTIWVYIATWLCSITVIASMAEMASMAPTSGGFVFVLSSSLSYNSDKTLVNITGSPSLLLQRRSVCSVILVGGSLR